MPFNIRCQAIRIVLILFAVLLQGAWRGGPLAIAEELPATTTSGPAWEELTPLIPRPPVRVWSIGPRKERAYVITHGMGGTAADDRFHQLAATIAKLFPDACVIRLDWCERASVKIFGLPNPFQVAASIDEVGDQAALLLQQAEIDPQRAIFIGESFGNWVNARIARQLGGVEGIIVLNPANEAGYPLPEVRRHALRTWALHTYSVFDTTHEVAASDCWLQTPEGANQWSQHVAGIHWLTARVAAGDTGWLRLEKDLPPRRAGHFQSLVTTDGSLSDEQPPRSRPARNPPASDKPQPATIDVVSAP